MSLCMGLEGWRVGRQSLLRLLPAHLVIEKILR
jgi:hypothetical protein